MNQSKHKVIVEQKGKDIYVVHNQTLLDALEKEGYDIRSVCGGHGLCGKCWVYINEGAPTPTEADRRFFDSQELKKGKRLSCMTKVTRDMRVEIPILAHPVSSKELMSESLKGLEIVPEVKKEYLELPLPGRDNQLPDAERISQKMQRKMNFPYPILRKLPSLIRENDFKVTVTYDLDGQVYDIQPGDRRWDLYGMGFDIGTTTVAIYILDLITGKELGVKSFENPQARFGADVISRIKHVHQKGEKGLKELQAVLLHEINQNISQMCTDREIDPQEVVEATFVGNPTMLHLLAGIDPSNIDHSPYISAFRSLTILSAKQLGLAINPLGKVFL